MAPTERHTDRRLWPRVHSPRGANLQIAAAAEKRGEERGTFPPSCIMQQQCKEGGTATVPVVLVVGGLRLRRLAV